MESSWISIVQFNKLLYGDNADTIISLLQGHIFDNVLTLFYYYFSADA